MTSVDLAARLPNRLRSAGWVFAFLALLAALLFPAILLSAHFDHEMSVWEQAGLIAAATVGIQLIRRARPSEVTGAVDRRTPRRLLIGAALGAGLMLVPAGFLALSGLVRWEAVVVSGPVILSAMVGMAGVAVAEELLFRGVLFQGLIKAIGAWPAQLAVAGLFVLTHLGNPGMVGLTKSLAGVNIFLASLLFGAAYLRTRGLAAPIALHFMANLVQGVVLGFGVSGNVEESMLRPRFPLDAAWLTGGDFGLEARVPGLVSLIAVLAAVLMWRGEDRPTN